MNSLSQWNPLFKIGQIYTIKHLQGDPDTISRMNELGFIQGHQFEILYQAPFRGPTVVDIEGTLVALRNEELACLQT